MTLDVLNFDTAPVGTVELFHLLRDGAPRTRSDLALQFGQSRGTIAARVDFLMARGLIEPVDDVYTGGRPSARFAFAPRVRLGAGIDIGGSHISVGVSDLAGAVLVKRTNRLDVSAGPDGTLTTALELLDACLEAIQRPLSDVVAMGVGLPSPVHQPSGLPVLPSLLPGWEGFDVAGWMAGRVDAVVKVDNDVNAMAIGEQVHSWADVDDLLYVKVGTGIGSGIIAGGVLQRGALGLAGDIGHIAVTRGQGVVCRCGSIGCLETMASASAIAANLSAEGFDVASAEDVIALARTGSRAAVQALREAGRDVGEVLSAAVGLLNPAVVVIGGSMSQAEHLIVGVREVVYSRSMPSTAEHLQVVQSRAGEDASIIGLSTIALRAVFSAQPTKVSE